MSRTILFSIASILAFTAGVSAADQNLRLTSGESASIELEENPSTGYSWRVDRKASSNLAILRIGKGGLEPVESRRNPPLAGAPGVRRWTIEALSKGRARIELVYERPWEKRPAERHSVRVEVSPR